MTSQMDGRDLLREQNGHIPLNRLSEEPDRGPEAEQRTARIRELNDLLRTTGRGGMVVLTNGIGALGLPAVNRIFAAVASFNDFAPDNDPSGEHDCATLTLDGKDVIWRIDNYDRSRRFRSPDPADPKVTVRVLTVMLGEGY